MSTDISREAAADACLPAWRHLPPVTAASYSCSFRISPAVISIRIVTRLHGGSKALDGCSNHGKRAMHPSRRIELVTTNTLSKGPVLYTTVSSCRSSCVWRRYPIDEMQYGRTWVGPSACDTATVQSLSLAGDFIVETIKLYRAQVGLAYHRDKYGPLFSPLSQPRDFRGYFALSQCNCECRTLLAWFVLACNNN